MAREILKTRTRMRGAQFIVTTHSPPLADLLPPEALYLCHRREGSSVIEAFADQGSLFKRDAIERSFNDEEEMVPVSERILRGDFDA